MTLAGSDAPTADATASRWPRWKSILLVASLALNLLILGAMATAAIRHRLWAAHQPRAQATVFDYARTLGHDRRRALLEQTRAERAAMRPYRLEIRRAREEARSALVATPFDPERFRLAQDRVLAAETRAREAAQGLFHALVVQMTPAERAGFAQFQRAADRPWRRHGPGRGAGDRDDDDAPAAGQPPASKK